MEIHDIRVRHSANRKKTVSARLFKGIMYVTAPQEMPEDRLQAMIRKLKERLEKMLLRRQLNGGD